MEYLSEEIRERFGSDNCCPKFLEPQSIENVTDQEIYSDGDPSEPHYYDLSEKQYTTSNFSSHFADESSRGGYNEFTDDNSRGYSEFNFITQMPLEVHIRSEDYEEDTSSTYDIRLTNAPDEKYMVRKRRAESQRRRRQQWDDDKRKFILERERLRQRMRRANFSEERRQRELEMGKLRQRNRRAMYTPEQLQKERELNRQRQRERRNQMTNDQRREELEISKIRQKLKRARSRVLGLGKPTLRGAGRASRSVKTEDKQTQCDLESEHEDDEMNEEIIEGSSSSDAGGEEQQHEETVVVQDIGGNVVNLKTELEENGGQIIESQILEPTQIIEQQHIVEMKIDGNAPCLESL